eukprot:COSAG02_NODE_7837_length_2825_cov_1.508437_1_plen_84_part_00
MRGGEQMVAGHSGTTEARGRTVGRELDEGRPGTARETPAATRLPRYSRAVCSTFSKSSVGSLVSDVGLLLVPGADPVPCRWGD